MNTFGKEPQIIHLPDLDPFSFYQNTSQNYSYSFLFESLSGPDSLSEMSVMGFDPEMIISCFLDKTIINNRDGTTSTISNINPLDVVRDLMMKKNSNSNSYRYLGGAVGIINYEAIKFFGDNSPKLDNTPLMEFGIYDDGIIYDAESNKSFYFYYTKNRLDEFKKNIQSTDFFKVSNIKFDIDKDTFTKMVNDAKNYIYDGDIFQVVLSRKYFFDFTGNPLKVYQTLRKLNPSPYMYHLKHNKRVILGASPEMLVRVSDKKIETFPIAGTRKITGDLQKDLYMQEDMLNDEKELAEHTMLVDLGRNDIGRVCKFGTVKVSDMMTVKKFSHVQHMVTHVTGEISSKYDMFDAFKAIFPAGTVSGSPKIRAMEIIDQLESTPRNSYAGAIGYFSYTGSCDFAIAIRSIFIDGQHGFIQAGAGIVSDSVPDNEFNETVHKSQAMIQALEEASK